MKKAFNRSWQPFRRNYRAAFPDKRLFRRFETTLKGLLTAQTPKVQRIAAAISIDPKVELTSVAKGSYRFLQNGRFSVRTLLEPLYRQTRHRVEGQNRVLAIIDLSPIEKPYARKMEGLCRVRKNDGSGTTNGYELLTILLSRAAETGLGAYRLFSHQAEAMSQNQEIASAMTEVQDRLPATTELIWVWDRGFDDQKNYLRVVNWRGKLVGRADHDRLVTVAGRKRRLIRWGNRLPSCADFSVKLSYCGRRRRVRIGLSWGQFELEGHKLWLVRARILWVEGLVLSKIKDRDWWLVTNLPIRGKRAATEVWGYYRKRWEIESFFKFLKDGLKLEKFQVMALEEIRRITALVVIAAMFLYQLSGTEVDEPIRLMLQFGGWTGRDKPGKAALKRGLSVILTYLAVDRFLSCNST